MTCKTLPPVIVIHGVGSPTLRSLVDQVKRVILPNAKPSCETIHHVDGFLVPAVHVTNDTHEINLYELNWSDIARPRRGVMGVLLHFIRIQFAMLQLAEAGWLQKHAGVSGPKWIGFALRHIMVAIAIWVPLLPMSVFYAAVFKPSWLAALLVLATTFAGCIAARALAHYDHLARAGYVWSALAFSAGLTTLFAPSFPQILLKVCLLTTGLAEASCGILALLGVGQTLIERRRGAGNQALVRCALYILPFSLMFGGIWSLIVGLNLFTAHYAMQFDLVDGASFRTFREYVEATHFYNVAFLEVVNASTTFAALISLVASIAVWQLLLLSGAVNGLKWGNAFRRILVMWLGLLPILAAVVLVAFLIDAFNIVPYVDRFDLSTIGAVHWIITTLMPKGGTEAVPSPADVYMYSSLRLLPIFFWLIPKLREAVSIMTDVLFYELPKKFSLATAEDTKSRLHKCVEFVRKNSGQDPTILAHSQGSRIAYDVIIQENLSIRRLVTVGSPIDTLYRDFLGIPHVDSLGNIIAWTNLYRLSDYIGGEIEGPNNEIVVANFRRAHSGYFVDLQVMRAVVDPQGPLQSNQGHISRSVETRHILFFGRQTMLSQLLSSLTRSKKGP